MKKNFKNNITRRKLMKGVAAAGSIAAMPGFVRYSQAASSSPIKIDPKFTELELEQLMGDGMIELHKQQ